MKKLLGVLRNTIDNNNLIEDGDVVAVGLSGGKDSMSLLVELSKYRRFSDFNFELHAIKVNLGSEKKDDDAKLRAFCDEWDVPLTIEETDIKKIVFDIRKEKNPCALCANMRRGTLSNVANKLGANKIALGHHKDDRIETFFMNLFYSGRLNTFEMKSYLSRKKVTIIRPFYNVDEKLINKFVKKYDIPVIKSNCIIDKNTKREEMKVYLGEVYSRFKHSDKSIENALKNKDQFNLW